MGTWCNFEILQPSSLELSSYRAELVQFTVELVKTAAMPLETGVEGAIVKMFDETVGRALVNGADWQSGQAFVLSRVRMCAREAARRAKAANAAVLSASVLEAAWAHEIKRTHAALQHRSVA